MESSLHRFVRLLRLAGMRVSVSEAADAMRAAAQPGLLAGRDALREALRVTLVKDRRDDEIFTELYDAFFALRRVAFGGGDEEHGHAHDDLADLGETTGFTVSEEPSQTPQQGHSHGKPADIRDFFDPQDLAQRYNLHQEANKIDLAGMTEEIVLSEGGGIAGGDRSAVQLTTDRLHNAGVPGRLAPDTGRRDGIELSVAQDHHAPPDRSADVDDGPVGERVDGFVENLSELLKRHLERLAELSGLAIEKPGPPGPGRVERVDEPERRRMEESLRRLARTLDGALTHRRHPNRRGRVHPARTMRHNMRYDGVPFRPITVSRSEDRPRLLVLADVSLSVRATARFTLHLVHGMQTLFGQVRSFAFVDEPVEITELFAEHPLERALGLVFDGLPAGGLLDVDGTSDYGRTFRTLLSEHSGALDRRTTLLVLGDGRGNGNDPEFATFEEITRRVRRTIWLTPEPRYSWRLGACDLPGYAEMCDRVQVVADLSGLERMAHRLAAETTGR